ncbi:hypothetical protein H6794_02295 [Candidatus Nomurabacteria bacterium]|jgi:hypothetical protein|nr:hypothetical protein [Candidatus Saccharibacteria bacterium]MCB9839662.1 hypothetical protein [Candidatus Nomurabacteria bacterium]
MREPKVDEQLTTKDYERIGRMMESIVATNYANKLRFFGFTFLRGMVYGLGLFIGGTIVVALVIWILTQFNEAPIIGPFLNRIVEILNTGTVKP